MFQQLRGADFRSATGERCEPGRLREPDELRTLALALWHVPAADSPGCRTQEEAPLQSARPKAIAVFACVSAERSLSPAKAQRDCGETLADPKLSRFS